MDTRLALRSVLVLAMAAAAVANAGQLSRPAATSPPHDVAVRAGSSPDGTRSLAEAALPEGPAVCFGPGSSPEEVEEFAREQAERAAASRAAGPQVESAQYQFSDGSRWTWTATDGCCLSQGQPTTLTYSFVPDGTTITGGAGEPTSPSDLFAFLNGIYGSPAVWMP